MYMYIYISKIFVGLDNKLSMSFIITRIFGHSQMLGV